jgi:hypothetical protein
MARDSNRQWGARGGGRDLVPLSRTPCHGWRLDEEGIEGGGGG